MYNDFQILIGVATALLLSSSSILAEEKYDETVKRDLFAVITLQGHACGSVASYQRLADSDYLAICTSGHRYRINVTPQGRVAVKKHEPQGQ